MPRIRPTIAITLAAVLAYVSGLAMHLHVVWEHAGPAEAAQVVAAHAGCSHGHGHSHGHSHSPDFDQPDKLPDQPAPESDCPTCVALAAFVATVTVADAGSTFDHLPCASLSIESRQAAHLTSLAHLPSRGPPLVA